MCSLEELCQYEVTETGAKLMGRKIRVNETGQLISVKDAISAIEGSSSNAAHKKYQRLIDANIIVEGDPAGFETFKHECNITVLGARVRGIIYLCCFIHGETAREITQRAFEAGMRYLDGEPELHGNLKHNDDSYSQINIAFSSLCEFEKTETGATLMGHRIRVDETGHLLSVKDAISAIEGSSSNAAHKKCQRLIDANIIVEGDPAGFEKFKHDNNITIMGAHVRMITYLCFYLHGERARAITQRVFEAGVRCLAGDTELGDTVKRRDDDDDPRRNSSLCLTRDKPLSKEKCVADFIAREFGADGWVFNQLCGPYRPDIMLKLETHAIVVEVDQNQHKGYDSANELRRMIRIYEELGIPVEFVRINPDEFTDERGVKHKLRWGINSRGDFVAHDEREWNRRLQILKEHVVKFKSAVSHSWHQTFLFYDSPR